MAEVGGGREAAFPVHLGDVAHVVFGCLGAQFQADSLNDLCALKGAQKD